MIRRNSIKIAALLLALSVVAFGCKKEEKPAPPPATPAAAPKPAVQSGSTSAKAGLPKGVQKQTSSSKGKTVAVQNQVSSMKKAPVPGTQIDFSGKKDPFKPFIVQPATPVKSKSASPAAATGLPIQSFDVNKFKLVGIVAGLKENRALIVDPFRKGYVVKTGMLLGNNNGRITRITGDALEVLEQFRDDNGILRKRTVRLVLPQKK